jgi:tRNA modification GTPase
VTVGVQLLHFPAPASATGEDVLEVHLPGSLPLVDRLVQGIQECGARLAEPGEFTRRAFLSGRLDLTQAEAVLDLVESRSADTARSAARLLSGSLGPALSADRDVLLAALVELEAGLDFEEGDSQDLEPGEVKHHLADAIGSLENSLAAEGKRRIRHGGKFRLGLVGPPNAGKTSLFRTLTDTPGMVSSEAGTTRDRREGEWVMSEADAPITLVDFPGMGGEAVDARDAAARRIAEGQDAHLDLIWLCLRPDTGVEELPKALPDAPCMVVWTQTDRISCSPSGELRKRLLTLVGQSAEIRIGDRGHLGTARLAASTRDRLAAAEEALAQSLRHSERHQAALEAALEALRAGQAWDNQGGHQDLVAEEIRSALWSLSVLVGEATPEEVLDRLFASFCIGK